MRAVKRFVPVDRAQIKLHRFACYHIDAAVAKGNGGRRLLYGQPAFGCQTVHRLYRHDGIADSLCRNCACGGVYRGYRGVIYAKACAIARSVAVINRFKPIALSYAEREQRLADGQLSRRRYAYRYRTGSCLSVFIGCRNDGLAQIHGCHVSVCVHNSDVRVTRYKRCGGGSV